MTTIEEKLEYVFKNRDLLDLALTHKSFIEGIPQQNNCNERLEFLGDAILNYILTTHIFNSFPEKDEGELSKIRAHLVSAATLFEIAHKISLTFYVKLGKGELKSSGRKKSSIISSALEALIGALFLDAGIETCSKIVLKLFSEQLQQIIDFKGYINDFKSELQELIQEQIKTLPVYYHVNNSEKKSEQNEFEVVVTINNQEVGRGKGKSKKDAEQEAAFCALRNIKNFSDFLQLSQTFFMKKERF